MHVHIIIFIAMTGFYLYIIWISLRIHSKSKEHYSYKLLLLGLSQLF